MTRLLETRAVGEPPASPPASQAALSRRNLGDVIMMPALAMIGQDLDDPAILHLAM